MSKSIYPKKGFVASPNKEILKALKRFERANKTCNVWDKAIREWLREAWGQEKPTPFILWIRANKDYSLIKTKDDRDKRKKGTNTG